jgi:hypothetical protein
MTTEARRAYAKEYVKTPQGKAAKAKAAKDFHDRKQQEWKVYLSTVVCSLCQQGHIAIIDWHHIDPSSKEGKRDTVSAEIHRGRSVEFIKQKIADKNLVPLCANCHRIVHYIMKRDNTKQIHTHEQLSTALSTESDYLSTVSENLSTGYPHFEGTYPQHT